MKTSHLPRFWLLFPVDFFNPLPDDWALAAVVWPVGDHAVPVWLHLGGLAVLTGLFAGAGAVASAQSVGNVPMGGLGAVTAQWPTELRPFGDPYPGAGATCRRVGESNATVDFLDDSSVLIGCLDQQAAAALGGRIVATIKGVTLVSVPAADRSSGQNTANDDAKVPGTAYHATATVQCSGYRKHPAGRCPAGVRRNAEGGLTVVEISWPDGDSRTLFFQASGRFLSANTNQADGSAAFQPTATRRGDWVVVTIGPERYVFAQALLTGD